MTDRPQQSGPTDRPGGDTSQPGGERPSRFRSGPRPGGAERGGRRFGGGGRRREPIYADTDVVDYKDISKLRRCIDERGRILPRRRLNTSAKTHRQVTLAVKRARHVALLPFVSSERLR